MIIIVIILQIIMPPDAVLVGDPATGDGVLGTRHPYRALDHITLHCITLQYVIYMYIHTYIYI